MEQKEYWNSVSEKKEFTTPFQEESFCKFVGKNAVVLDVGCGYGRTLNELYRSGYRNLIGIDFSSEMIARGKREFPNIDFRIKKNSEIEMENDSVDAVILFAVLTCISDNQTQKELLDEIKRILKPNGILYVNDFLLNTDLRNVTRYKSFEEKYAAYGVFELEEGAVLRHHEESYIKELLSDFEELEYSKLVFRTMNGNKSNGFYYIGKSKI